MDKRTELKPTRKGKSKKSKRRGSEGTREKRGAPDPRKAHKTNMTLCQEILTPKYFGILLQSCVGPTKNYENWFTVVKVTAKKSVALFTWIRCSSRLRHFAANFLKFSGVTPYYFGERGCPFHRVSDYITRRRRSTNSAPRPWIATLRFSHFYHPRSRMVLFPVASVCMYLCMSLSLSVCMW